ncbi:MAG: hypothetical protein RLZZ301_208 [Bacteroidota bacterium]|jgi:hypothetical protein
MKWIKRLFYLFLFTGIFLLIAGLFIDNDYRVQRSVVIAAPRDAVFQYVKQLKNQENFGVWWKQDPHLKAVYSGTEATPGFTCTWYSKEVGNGAQKIMAIQEGQRIDTRLQLETPFKSTNQLFISTNALGSSNTRVVWGFNGTMPYPFNSLKLVFSPENRVGQDLETGLKNLKRLLEK